MSDDDTLSEVHLKADEVFQALEALHIYAAELSVRLDRADMKLAQFVEAVEDVALELEGTERDRLLAILARFGAKETP